MKKIIAIVAGAVLALGLSTGPSSADDTGRANGWDRKAPAAKAQDGLWLGGWVNKTSWTRGGTAVIYAWAPEPTTGAIPYRVVKAGRAGNRYQVVAKGHVSQDEVDQVRVRFPKANTPRYIQIWSQGRLVSDRLIRMKS